MANDASHYRPDIDGLRAVAVLAVVFYHAFPDAVPGGFVGVDVFFVVSGYLITGIILRAAGDGSFAFASFYARRIRRIFPSLLLVLIVGYAVGWREMLPSEFQQFCRSVVAAAGFASNFFFWSETSYFDAAAESKPLLHLWSLGIEEQFYAVWPLALLIAWRSGRARALTLLLAIGSFALSCVEIGNDPAAAFYSPAPRFWELLAGALLAQIDLPAHDARPSPSAARLSAADFCSIAGLCLVLLPAQFFTRATPFPGPMALPPVLGTMLLIGAGRSALVNRAVLSRPALVWIGLISYPLYLWHWPLLSFAHVVGVGNAGIEVRTGLVAASFGLAAASYHFIEKPIRRRQHGIFKVVSLCAVMLGVGVLALATSLADGVPARFPEAIRSLASYRYDYRQGARWKQCWLSEDDPHDGFAEQCLPPVGGKAGILLWGDSQAARLYPGLREAASASLGIYQLTRSGCAPILGGGHPNCARSNLFVLEQIRRTTPDTVVLHGSWGEYGSNWEAGSHIAEAFEKTLGAIRAAGVRRIVVVGPGPRWSRPLPRLLVTYWINHSDLAAPPGRMGFGLNVATRVIDRRLRAVATGRPVDYVSLLDVLCDENGCLTMVPGSTELTSWDEGHLTSAGALFVGRKLFASDVLP